MPLLIVFVGCSGRGYDVFFSRAVKGCEAGVGVASFVHALRERISAEFRGHTREGARCFEGFALRGLTGSFSGVLWVRSNRARPSRGRVLRFDWLVGGFSVCASSGGPTPLAKRGVVQRSRW